MTPPSWWVLHGDSAAVLKQFPDCSFDSVVCDPPAGIAFMSKKWDNNLGSRARWVAWLAGIMRECLRVLKPGGHALVWALPRTSHWTTTALEDAGFEVRDIVMHVFGTGFPKSMDVGKAIDKAAGVDREVIGRKITGTMNGKPGATVNADGAWASGQTEVDVTAPATDAAKQWDGWGTALKPAAEHWILVRKPLVGTVVVNLQAHGTGAINVAGCRVESGELVTNHARSADGAVSKGIYGDSTEQSTHQTEGQKLGRWPPHLVLSHAEGCEPIGPQKVRATSIHGEATATRRSGVHAAAKGHQTVGRVQPVRGFADADGTETIDAWECVEGCPVAMMDAQGGASRFFPRFQYVAKPSTREREAGLGDHEERRPDTGRTPGAPGGDNPRNRGGNARKNSHPTVKATTLMRWLVRLITPPGGRVLDPFAGSGSTGLACLQEGMVFVGIEREAEYVAIARARLVHAAAELGGSDE